MTCGRGAALSFFSAAELQRIVPRPRATIHVSIPTDRRFERQGIVVHRAKNLENDAAVREGIRVTTPVRTLMDLASTQLSADELEAAVFEAARLRLITLGSLRRSLDEHPHQPGAGRLRRLVEKRTFTLSQTRLERLFVPIALDAGLSRPLSQQWVNGFRVDFYWPKLGLVVETDGGEWHRDARQQTIDRRRDQAHATAGLTPLRFTHYQVAHERQSVRRVLTAVAARLLAG
jgi:very-short-patch-repair endonuclease